MNINIKRDHVLLGILLLAFFIRFFRLSELMIFGGDVARDYLTARDITLKGFLPLIGCPTSIIWLFQGPFFIYILGLILPFWGYNPLAGGIFVALMGTMSVFVIYKLGCYFFSRSTGIYAALLYSTSPLVVIFDRYPFHQSLISLFTMLFFITLYFSFKKNIKFLLLSFLFWGLLLQLELSGIIFGPILFLILFDYRKKYSLKILFGGIVLFILTWLPKIIYDFSHGFTQTAGFFYWIIYRLLPIRIGNKISSFYPVPIRFLKIFIEFKKLIFWPSFFISFIILLCSFIFLLKKFSFKERRNALGKYLVLLWLVFPLIALFLHGAPAESYIPPLFAVPPLLIGNFIHHQQAKIKIFLIEAVVLLTVFNAIFLIKNDYFMLTGKPSLARNRFNLGQSFKILREMSEFIIKDANGQKYNLVALGDFAYFPSSKMNLVYLNWYLGNEPSEKEETLKYFIYYKNEERKIVNSALKKNFPYMTIVKQMEEIPKTVEQSR